MLEVEPGLAFQTLDVEWRTSIECNIDPHVLREQVGELAWCNDLTICLSEHDYFIDFGTRSADPSTSQQPSSGG